VLEYSKTPYSSCQGYLANWHGQYHFSSIFMKEERYSCSNKAKLISSTKIAGLLLVLILLQLKTTLSKTAFGIHPVIRNPTENASP
jgi:hypothetical protein